MFTRSTRLLVLGLLACALPITACGGTPWLPPSGSIFDDAGNDALAPPPASGGDDGMAADNAPPPISLLPDAQGPEVAVDACASGACDDAAMTSVCGDGVIGVGEQCDDGNSIPGDGCSGVCQIEPGYTCPDLARPCVYTVTQTCGDGIIQGREACDDGNKVDGDGCSAACQVENGFSCSVPGTPCTKNASNVCGDGKVGSGEQCDDGNTLAGDGCSATCSLEQGWTCPAPGSACQRLQYCGDGVVQTSIGEQCDDGNAIPGDGCSGVCRIEPGNVCPTAGQPCVRLWICGNGKVDPGEACDDGNTASGDGCSSACTVEPGYTCPNANGSGGPCIKAQPNTCGDSILGGTEQCDDGNTNSGDGCSSTCKVEAGYTCASAGAACTKIEFCGDRVVNLDIGEQCDDGNTLSGDGCSSLCQSEPNYVCLTPGAPCISTVICGDGKVAGSETCDDGNAVSSDGCSSTCKVETGWQCPTPAAKCVAKQCGDGVVAGTEQCDDGNTTSGDGCSATCTLETGFACSTQGSPPTSSCHKTVCGDGTKEGFEQCDDGNLIAYDGCSPTCTIEPKCNGMGGCAGVCGDGLVFPGEQCDDGNTNSGDGCSSTCQLETGTGYSCLNVNQPPAATLTIPILYRDMLYWNTASYPIPQPIGGGHPDFNHWIPGVVTGLVQSTLGPDSEPVWKSNGPVGKTALSGAVDYCWWYHEKDCNGAGTTNPYDKPVYLDASGKPTTLVLNQQGAGSTVYQFNNQSLFPLDGLGWNAGTNPQTDVECGTTTKHNFSFTSELHYPFTYQASAPTATFDFTGDDDVWAFINNQLVVDLGGVHAASSGSVTLDSAEATALGLTDGGWYSIDLFQAERHTCASTYKMTLGGFAHTIAQCQTVCGDGVVAGDEQCDEGANNGSGYGHCTSLCTLGPRCDDGLVQSPPEQCDDGTNLTTYGGAAKACGPGCKWAPFCGDGVVSNGEQCDEGLGNGSGYGHCTSSCTLGPRCGDGLLQSPQEQCDDAVNNGSSGDKCNANCTLKCGDGVLEPGEQCDNGAVSNTGGYGGCNATCTLGPYCGDAIKNGSEQCDDGKNDGTYGTCSATCTLAAYCGDGTVQNPPELCDQGAANSAAAYGANLCTNRCTPAPYCGDKQVEGQFGETCDDGVNSGQPGSCTPDCKSNVALPSCGNGVVDLPEQCDDGSQNGAVGDPCDTHCRFTCGNGIREQGEQCDNGVNDGSYGTCNPNCTLGAYCGDGITSGPETCDNGASNAPSASAYGPSVCTTACTWAPYCGDGRVQSRFGEQCDSSYNCTPQCQNASAM
jgi:fibro-slime domain-containing protein